LKSETPSTPVIIPPADFKWAIPDDCTVVILKMLPLPALLCALCSHHRPPLVSFGEQKILTTTSLFLFRGTRNAKLVCKGFYSSYWYCKARFPLLVAEPQPNRQAAAITMLLSNFRFVR
jgi:hypothetical protein